MDSTKQKVAKRVRQQKGGHLFRGQKLITFNGASKFRRDLLSIYVAFYRTHSLSLVHPSICYLLETAEADISQLSYLLTQPTKGIINFAIIIKKQRSRKKRQIVTKLTSVPSPIINHGSLAYFGPIKRPLSQTESDPREEQNAASVQRCRPYLSALYLGQDEIRFRAKMENKSSFADTTQRRSGH